MTPLARIGVVRIDKAGWTWPIVVGDSIGLGATAATVVAAAFGWPVYPWATGIGGAAGGLVAVAGLAWRNVPG